MPVLNADFTQWISQLDDKDPAKVYVAREKLMPEVLHSTAPSEKERKAEAARVIVEAISAEKPVEIDPRTKQAKPPVPKYSAAARNYLIRLLSYVPSDESLPTLKKALDDMETREMARWALERNPSNAATGILISAMNSTGPVFRAGVVNTLARRRSPDVQKILVDLTNDLDALVRTAATEALKDA